ncbi:DNA-binding domain-containing protein [Roseibium aggregatum]|nr:DNA-binding domain-containing protein [Roseibium aggregatum]
MTVFPSKTGAKDFAGALLDSAAATPDGIVGPDGKAAPKRFNVYRNNVVVSLCEALGQIYPAVKTLLGDEYFNAVARAFVTRHPPQSPVLIWYGGAFAAFIEEFPPLEAYPYLVDVARAEWSWLQAYHAADAAPMDPALLGALDPEKVGEARLEKHPAALLVRSDWPVLDLLRANRFFPEDAVAVDLSLSQSVLITRPDLDVEIRLPYPGGAVFIEALFEGFALAEAAGKAQSQCAEFSLSDCLSDCLSSGAFTGLTAGRE